MKFSEMPYKRPDLEEIIRQSKELTENLKQAQTYEEAREVFLQKDQLMRHTMTQETLASIRHSIDTRDAFYKEEFRF